MKQTDESGYFSCASTPIMSVPSTPAVHRSGRSLSKAHTMAEGNALFSTKMLLLSLSLLILLTLLLFNAQL
jgi:hypothetical protein